MAAAGALKKSCTKEFEKIRDTVLRDDVTADEFSAVIDSFKRDTNPYLGKQMLDGEDLSMFILDKLPPDMLTMKLTQSSPSRARRLVVARSRTTPPSSWSASSAW